LDIIENTYNQYEKHDYHVINIKDVEWGTLPQSANYHNILFNLETKEAIFALFIGIGGLCWIVPQENYNKVSFANTHVESSFSIVLNDSRFVNEYRKKYNNGLNIGIQNAQI